MNAEKARELWRPGKQPYKTDVLWSALKKPADLALFKQIAEKHGFTVTQRQKQPFDFDKTYKLAVFSAKPARTQQ